MGEFKHIMQEGVLCQDNEGNHRQVVPFVAGWLADGAEIPRLTHTPAPPHGICHICTRPNLGLGQAGILPEDELRTCEQVNVCRSSVQSECWDFEKACVKKGSKGRAEKGLSNVGLQPSALAPTAAPIYRIFRFMPSMQVCMHVCKYQSLCDCNVFPVQF